MKTAHVRGMRRSLLLILSILMLAAPYVHAQFIENFLQLRTSGAFGINTTTLNIMTANTSRLYITQAGLIGIGTSSPNKNLVVVGSVNITDSLNVSGTVQAARFFGDGSGLTGISAAFINGSDINVTRFVANNTLFVNDSRVGIGTNNPSKLLEIFGGSSDSAQLRLNGNNGNLGIELIDNAGSTYNWRIESQNLINNAFAITPSTTTGGTTFSLPSFLIAGATGFLGIGTSNPTKKLSVNGTLNAITFDPSAGISPLINTTGNNLTLSSATGSVIIRLG